MKKAVFVDRDGTINTEKEYLHKISEFEFIEGVPEAIKKLNENKFLVVIVTNQAGVARGYYQENEVELLHRHINNELKKYDAFIDKYYYCPHHPVHGIGKYKKNCDCRKPNPGMILQAAAELGIDLNSSYMVGDKAIDVETSINAGCKPILVLTGYGNEEKLKLNDLEKVTIYKDFGEAVDCIIKS